MRIVHNRQHKHTYIHTYIHTCFLCVCVMMMYKHGIILYILYILFIIVFYLNTYSIRSTCTYIMIKHAYGLGGGIQ